MKHMKEVLEELDVRYTMPVQPVLVPRGTGMPTHATQQATPGHMGPGAAGWVDPKAFGGLSGGLDGAQGYHEVEVTVRS